MHGFFKHTSPFLGPSPTQMSDSSAPSRCLHRVLQAPSRYKCYIKSPLEAEHLSFLSLKNGVEAKDTLTLFKRIYTTTTTTTTSRGCNCLAFFVDFCSAPLRPGADGTKMCSPA